MPNFSQAPAFTREAKWIWGGENPRPQNSFRLFRREFLLGAQTDQAYIYIFAEARYKLYINGRFIQTGPAPCQPEHRLWDALDVTPYMARGNNCIAVLAYNPGIMTGQFTLVNPGLVCAFRAIGAKAETTVLTDATWRSFDPGAWVTPTLLCPYAKGFHEWHRAYMMPRGWEGVCFDDSGWDFAFELPFYAYADFTQLNYTGNYTLTQIPASRLIACGLGDGVVTHEMERAAALYYTNVKNRERKLMGNWIIERNAPLPEGEPLPAPVAHLAAMENRSFPSVPVARQAGDTLFPIIIDTDRPGHPFLTLDMGEVRSGLFTLALHSHSGGTVDIGWDDRVNDDGTVPLLRSTPSCDRVEVPSGEYRWDGFFERGARYLQVMLRGFMGQLTIRSIGVLETLLPYPKETLADFSSSNALLDSIWRASVNTMKQYRNGCGYGDAIRERCHWLTDDFMALRMAFYWCGDWKEMRRALELTAQSQYADGSFPVVSPGHFEDFNMVIGSCSWASNVREYCFTTGDWDFGRNMLPHIGQHINYELRFADRDGLLYETPGRRFLSWADGNPRPPYKYGETWMKTGRKSWGDFFDPVTMGYNAIINIHWLWCLRSSADLAHDLDQVQTARKYRDVFERAKCAFHTLFWDDQYGLYRDNVTFNLNGVKNAPTFCESTLYYLMKTGLIDRESGLACYDRIQDNGFVCCRSSGGLELGAAAAFLLDAGRFTEALSLYQDRWGAAILGGATSMGEEFFRSRGNSDCHIHGATPARDFLEYLAGMRMTAPMWGEVSLTPPYGLKGLSFVARTPARDGFIMVEVSEREGAAAYRYSVPEGCRCRVRQPDRRYVDAPANGVIRL